MTLVIAPTARTTYDVSAPDLSGAADIITAEPEAGRCDWQITYEWDGTNRNGTAAGLTVHLTITIRLPHWVEREQASHAERDEWDRFLAALRDHEEGHKQIARAGARALEERLRQTQASDLQTAFDEEQAKIQAQSDAYDRANDHGRKPPPGTTITIP